MTDYPESATPTDPYPCAIEIDQVSFRYGAKLALDQLSLAVPQGSLFGLLGPNGGGKTTLFRLLTTLAPVQSGRIKVGGLDLATAPDRVRRAIGVTFQAPSLDRRLTVHENLACHGRLYGLSGAPLHQRIDQLLGQLGLGDRRRDRVDSLSGGLARRVEIAKGLLHAPQLLLLDEPSSGLDPGARIDLWRYLRTLQSDAGVTVLLTTHLMEEAEKCAELALLDRGRVVARGSPAALRAELGGDCLTLRSAHP
ncbi:MAG: ATP-binding cassette domain-containing protein, partial [Planctomycetaceae bacterium]